MNLKLSRDTNGNKVLKVSFESGTRGFSVQTLGKLPKTHRMTNDDLNQSLAANELNGFIKIYGTPRQKELLGWH